MPNPNTPHPESDVSNSRISADANAELSRVARARRDERGFVAFELATVTGGGGTLNIQFENPSGSGKLLDISRFVFSTQFLGQVSVFDEFSSAPSGGTASNIDNLLMDTGNDNGGSVANVNKDVSFTATKPHWQAAIPSGGQGGNTSGGKIGGTEPIIEPDRQIVMQVTNNATEDRDASVGVVYVERDPELTQ